ncbi:MAG: hypothetical protein U1E26_07605 [Coriobacteriia bacterium]|nr:hypothetical protein [Coriobacteriia bacterium]
MRVEVDIEEELFAEAAGLARRLRWSIDRLVTEALSDYVAGRSADGMRGSFSGIDTPVSREDDRI